MPLALIEPKNACGPSGNSHLLLVSYLRYGYTATDFGSPDQVGKRALPAAAGYSRLVVEFINLPMSFVYYQEGVSCLAIRLETA